MIVKSKETAMQRKDPFAVPLGFKLWFAFCGLLGLGFLGLIVWAVVKLVNHFAG